MEDHLGLCYIGYHHLVSRFGHIGCAIDQLGWATFRVQVNRSNFLEFPYFLENTVVPERKLVERWGTHRGRAELVLSLRP